MDKQIENNFFPNVVYHSFSWLSIFNLICNRFPFQIHNDKHAGSWLNKHIEYTRLLFSYTLFFIVGKVVILVLDVLIASWNVCFKSLL